jgi:hypothetical protein
MDLGGSGIPPCREDAGPAASCAYSGPYDDGRGYFGGMPAECADSSGPPAALASTDEVTAALIGAWTGCGQGGPYAGAPSSALQFTSDGRFAFFVEDAAWNLNPLTGSANQGTFVVLDASSTLGPGTYQVRFTADNGGVFLSQVAVLAAPAKLRFFAPGANDFAPARTWQFRAGVCGPQFDTTDVCSSGGGALLSRMVGRWVWCSGPIGMPFVNFNPTPQPGTPYVGIEIHPDATWAMLSEDVDGGLIPAPTVMFATASGTLQIESSQTQWISGNETGIDPGIPLVDACGRVFLPSPVYACAACKSATPTCNGETCPLSPSDSGELVRVQ